MAQDGTVWFKPGTGWILVGVVVLVGLISAGILQGRSGRDIHTRNIPGIDAVEDAVGRAVEMGRPVVYVTGTQGITKAGTIAGLSVLGLVAQKCAETGARLIVPCVDPIVTSVARESVEGAYSQAGRHDLYRPEDVFFISRRQLAYTAGVAGIVEREHPATMFLMGEFAAESLIFGETGSRAGAFMVAGTDKETQLPFFVASCDHTLIGEELYAAGAAISRDKQLLGSLRGVDMGRVAIAAAIVVGFVAELTGGTWLRSVLGG